MRCMRAAKILRFLINNKRENGADKTFLLPKESKMNNKVALITGASKGLGLALAQGMAQTGWTLIIDARGADGLASAEKQLADYTTVVALAGDISDTAHQQALAIVARDLGGLNAVINNAGTLGVSPLPDLLDYPIAELEKVFRINTLAPLALLQTLRPHIHANAAIVNITSDAAVEAYEGWGGYGASKAAVEQWSAVLAAENPAWRVYWIDPGDMRTEMHQMAFPGEDISDRDLPEASVPGLLHLIEGMLPSGRYAAKQMEVATWL